MSEKSSGAGKANSTSAWRRVAAPFRNVSLKIKLPVALAAAGVLGAAVVGTAAFLNGKHQIEAQSGERLESLTASRAATLGTYLASISQDVRTQAANPRVAEAIATMQEAAERNVDLRRLYIADNPHRAGDRQKLVDAGDGSSYSQAHATYHPWFRRFQEARGYYDLFLFDTDGDVI